MAALGSFRRDLASIGRREKKRRVGGDQKGKDSKREGEENAIKTKGVSERQGREGGKGGKRIKGGKRRGKWRKEGKGG